MKLLHREDIPCWFTLTIDSHTGSPCIVIENDVLAELPTPRDRIIEHIRETLGLDEARFPYNNGDTQYMGFGTSLARAFVNETHTTYICNMPRIHFFTGEACEFCGGKGEDDFGECFQCQGTGKERQTNQKSAFALSVSLSLLMLRLEVFGFDKALERQSVIDAKQLLTVTMSARQGMHGCPIGGSFSPHFVNFFKSMRENSEFPAIKHQMCMVQRRMREARSQDACKYAEASIRARQNLPGNLILEVPGDACDIGPSPCVHDIPNGEGVGFSCHNTDAPIQQLTLFTGLAAACDLVG